MNANSTKFELNDTTDVVGNKFLTRAGETVTFVARPISGRKFQRKDGSVYWVGFASGAVFSLRDDRDDVVSRVEA